MKNLVDRYETALKTWTLLLPTVNVPPQETLVLWLGSYPDHLFERALLNVARKFKDRSVEPLKVYRCISADLAVLKKYWRPNPARPVGGELCVK